MGLVTLLIPPFNKTITYIHELGHKLHIIYFANKWNLPKERCKIVLHKQTRHKTFYSGYCKTNVYTYFEQHTKDKAVLKHIRINSVSGSLFCILFLSLLLVLFRQYDLLVGFFLCHIFIELFNFFRSSDFRYFKQPQTFKYKYTNKKLNKTPAD